MKALSLWQPHASLVAIGSKKIETRSWGTTYRGPLAIHAAKARDTLDLVLEEPFRNEFLCAGIEPDALPLGFVVAVAELYECRVMTNADVLEREKTEAGRLELAFGAWEPGRWAWFLRDVKRVEPPIAARGRQQVYEWEPPAARTFYVESKEPGHAR